MSEENVAIVQSLFAAWARRDGAAGQALLDSEVELDARPFPFPGLRGLYSGHEGSELFFGDLIATFDSFEFHPLSFIDAGDEVLVWIGLSGHGRASGTPFETRGVAVYSLRGGLVTKIRMYETLAAATQAVGI